MKYDLEKQNQITYNNGFESGKQEGVYETTRYYKSEITEHKFQNDILNADIKAMKEKLPKMMEKAEQRGYQKACDEFGILTGEGAKEFHRRFEEVNRLANTPKESENIVLSDKKKNFEEASKLHNSGLIGSIPIGCNAE